MKKRRRSLDEELQQFSNEKAFDLVLPPLAIIGFAALEWQGHLLNLPRQPVLYTIIAAILFLVGALLFWRQRKRIRRLRDGLEGERYVAQMLEPLRGEGAHSLRDLRADETPIDHVLVTRRGIFVIETLHWMKRGPQSSIRVLGNDVFKDGRRVRGKLVEPALTDAKVLREMLRRLTGQALPVRPVLMFPGWGIERQPTEERAAIWAANPKLFATLIQAEPLQLSPDQVSMVRGKLAAFAAGE